MPPAVTWPTTVRLTLGDAINVERLAASVPGLDGKPFLTPAQTVSLALEAAARTAAAGELGRFRAPPPEAAVPTSPPPDPEKVAAWLARMARQFPAPKAGKARRGR